MVASLYGEVHSPRNAAPCLSVAAGLGCATPPGTDPTLSPNTRDILLGALAGSAPVTLDELVRLLPDHPQPLSAVIALVDTGAAAMDLASAFDGSCRIWRDPVPPCRAVGRSVVPAA